MRKGKEKNGIRKGKEWDAKGKKWDAVRKRMGCGKKKNGMRKGKECDAGGAWLIDKKGGMLGKGEEAGEEEKRKEARGHDSDEEAGRQERG
jgi:hypothetical protein